MVQASAVPIDAPESMFVKELVIEVAGVLDENPTSIDVYELRLPTFIPFVSQSLLISLHPPLPTITIVTTDAAASHVRMVTLRARRASLSSLGMDSVKMHSLSGVMQHRFGLHVTAQQLFAPTTSVLWLAANRVPLSEQRILDDGTVQPAATAFVYPSELTPAATAPAGTDGSHPSGELCTVRCTTSVPLVACCLPQLCAVI